MDLIVAALDHGPSFQPVARAARSMATLFDARAVGLHVGWRTDAWVTQELTSKAGFDVDVQSPTVAVSDALLDRIERPEVCIAVVGACSRHHDRPATGHVPLELAERTGKPLLVVPTRSTLGQLGTVGRVLVPLDGSRDASEASSEMLAVLTAAGVEVVATHVLVPERPLAFADAAHHAFDAWRREFLARHAAPASRLDLRRGTVWGAIADSAHDVAADLVLLAWSQHLEPGRATVIREALANLEVPVLLLPAG